MLYTYKESGLQYADRNLNFGLRANYMYDRRYVAEYSGSLIGSQYLSPANRWGYAQAFGVAWMMSEENFMDGLQWLDYFKLKAVYGATKTDIDNGYSDYHLWEDTYSSGSAYNYGDGAGANNMMTLSRGNPDLSFIRRNELNVGFEALLLKGRLSTEANYFNSLRMDVVERLTSLYPNYLGGVAFIPAENYGRVREQGFEAGVSYRLKQGEFDLTLGLNAVWYDPKMLRTNEEQYGQGMEYRQKVGKSSKAVWGLLAEGLYTQQEIDRINSSDPNVVRPTYGVVRAGDIRYRDLNGDMKIDDRDVSVIGSSAHKAACALTLNASWRNFNLWVYFETRIGQKTVDDGSYYWVYGEEMKYPASLAGRWSYDPATGVDTRATATYPRLTISETGNNYQNSSYWVSDKSYFAMPAVQLTYAFDKRIAQAVRMKEAMVFVRAQNLFKVGPNADRLQLNVGSEPQMRWYYVGVKAQF
jgi:hypothetical protein